MRTFLFTLLYIFVAVFQTQSQEFDIDQFYDHLPYNEVIAVADAGERLYAATPYSVFIYNHSDNSIERLTKVEGLSDIDISWIAYNHQEEALFIAYENTNIDIFKDGEIINISDIKRKTILGNKTINKIYMQGKYAYLACGFGVVVVDVEREEIYDTYKIGPDGSLINVYDFTYHPQDNHFYAATELGVIAADADSPNLAHFVYWENDTTLSAEDAIINAVASHHDKVIVNKSRDQYGTDTLFYKTPDSAWQVLESPNNTNVTSMRSFGDYLYVAYQFSLFIFDKALNYADKLYTYGVEGGLEPKDLWLDADSTFWIADAERGLVKTEGNNDGEFIHPSGPAYPTSFDMATYGDEVWVASGGYQSDWGGSILRHGLYQYQDSDWISYNDNEYDLFDTIPDIVSVAVQPGSGSKVYAGSWNKGLLEITDGEITNIFNTTNSSLQGNVAAPKLVQISGLAFDDEGNLWVVNNGAEEVLSVMEPNGEWRSYNLGSVSSGAFLGDLIIDDFGQKWIIMRDHRILVYNDNGTMDNPSDDFAKVLTGSAGNGALPGTYSVNALAKDIDGNIWIGTDEGVGVIYNPEDVFTGNNFDAERPKVEVDGYVQYLLNSEDVTAIEVDGANNKWFGTERAGVFLMSPDGTEQYKNFNEENSPLFSNEISAIAINDRGMVFIGTSKGIISYEGKATPGKANNKDIFVYPNPVKSEYNGPIYIINLVQEANVKITDIAGNLVYETFAEGGKAQWNGRNFDGQEVQTGYYMVFVSNDDGTETIVTKVLVFR